MPQAYRLLTNAASLSDFKINHRRGRPAPELHGDGRLEVEVETEALEPERQFVAFDASHLDQLVRKIAALGL